MAIEVFAPAVPPTDKGA